jgi:two-component system phosphate regulon sensor histidine kinase PhoR
VTARIFLKLIAGIVALLALAGFSADWFATRATAETYVQNLKAQLEQKARSLALVLPAAGPLDSALVRSLANAAGGRLTIIRADGKVLADSDANPDAMENHSTRPEFVQALAGRPGADTRTSATLGVRFLYVAVPYPAGALRIAVPLSQIEEQTARFRREIFHSTAIAFLPALLIAAVIARLISGRFAGITAYAAELARGNFRARLPDDDSSEFGPLARTLNETAANLQRIVEQLEREHAELEKLERVRKDFVINVSHELRTPLASIQGYTETLLDGALHDPDHNVRFLRIIRHNAERLTRITEDLLTLSRIEQKRQKFEFDSHPVSVLLADAIDLMRPIARKSSISLELNPPAYAAVWCDSEAVSQILSNLLDNAIKYTGSGGSIRVGAAPRGEFIEIYVRDTGIGIPAEDVPRLFERFYRVDKARSRELGGTGLGLSIVKHLVAAQGGSIRVESTPGQGSTFFFTLPLDRTATGRDRLNPEFTSL